MSAESLVLPSGRLVYLAERAPGGSKNETRFGRLESGEPVVIKIQAHHGQLDVEARALRYLVRTMVRVPRVIEFGKSGEGIPVLVISRADGVRATGPEGWRRFGEALAGLARVPLTDCPFEVVTLAEFTADHRQRLAQVVSILDARVSSRIEKALEVVEAVRGPLVVTHGDAGSGNYLDDGGAGTILDWETASVGPLGSDLGRGAFIALMDLGHTGHPIAQSRAFVLGYRNALADVSALDDTLVDAWITVAGLQFIHGRLIHPLRSDRTPQDAAQTLTEYLFRD